MTTHMARHFQRTTIEMGLSLTQLARMVGYTSMSKGYRKIDAFERTGRCHPDPVRQADGGVGDRREDTEPTGVRGLQGLACRRPRQPAYTVHAAESRSGAASGCPRRLTTVEEMERYASNHARRAWSGGVPGRRQQDLDEVRQGRVAEGSRRGTTAGES